MQIYIHPLDKGVPRKSEVMIIGCECTGTLRLSLIFSMPPRNSAGVTVVSGYRSPDRNKIKALGYVGCPTASLPRESELSAHCSTVKLRDHASHHINLQRTYKCIAVGPRIGVVRPEFTSFRQPTGGCGIPLGVRGTNVLILGCLIHRHDGVDL